MSSRNILFISSWFPDRVTHNNGDFVQRHAEAAARFNRVVVLFVKFDPAMEEGFERIENKRGNYNEVFFYFKNRRGYADSLRKNYYYFKYYLEGYKYIRANFFEPDLVHANITFPVGMVAWLFLRIYKKPYIISEHWSAYLKVNRSKLPGWRKTIDRFVARRAQRMLPVTANMRESLTDLRFHSVFSVVPNVVDVELFSPPEEPYTGHTFIHLSTLNDEVKNISGMLRAVKKLSEKRKDFSLQIFGIQDIDRHINYAEELGIYGNRVTIHAYIPHDAVPKRLRESMCVVMFSNFESLPCIITEALACGIPVISSDVGGIGEFITEKEGIMVPKGDENALTSAMDYILDNIGQYNQRHLREYAIRNFSHDSVASLLNSIYTEVLTHG